MRSPKRAITDAVRTVIGSSPTGTGTGATQTYTINGTMAGGYGGTCATAACSASQTRTLALSW